MFMEIVLYISNILAFLASLFALITSLNSSKRIKKLGYLTIKRFLSDNWLLLFLILFYLASALSILLKGNELNKFTYIGITFDVSMHLILLYHLIVKEIKKYKKFKKQSISKNSWYV